VKTHRSLLQRLTATANVLDADELREETAALRCLEIDCLVRGSMATVTGRLKAVVYNPRATLPTLEAQLYDGTSSIELVWLGRRRITGIEPGRRLIARGRVGVHEGHLAIYNPWYSLRGQPQ
jgi:hypothetical protein